MKSFEYRNSPREKYHLPHPIIGRGVPITVIEGLNTYL